MVAKNITPDNEDFSFRPEAMLPMWFVTDNKLVVRNAHAPLLKELRSKFRNEKLILTAPNHSDLILWAGLRTGNISKELAKPLRLETPDKFTSIWELLFRHDDQDEANGLDYVAILLGFLERHLNIIENFNQGHIGIREIGCLVGALNEYVNNSSSSRNLRKDGIFGYAEFIGGAATQQQSMQTGVRIVRPQGIMTTMKSTPFCDIICAWRLTPVVLENGHLEVRFDGIQPALHDATERRTMYRQQTWFQINTVMHHVTGEGLSNVGTVLAATHNIAEHLCKSEASKNQVIAMTAADETLQDKFKRCSDIILEPSGQVAKDLLAASKLAVMHNNEQKQYNDLMAFLGNFERCPDDECKQDVFNKYVGTQHGPFCFESEEIIEAQAIDVLNSVIAANIGGAMQMSQDFRHRPLIVKLPTQWTPVEFLNKTAITFILRTLLSNAFKYSSKAQPYELSLQLINNSSYSNNPDLVISLTNDLNIKTITPSNGKPSCSSCKRNYSELHRFSGKYFCNECLKGLHQNKLKRSKRGLLLVEYIAVEHWGGRTFNSQNILYNWDAGPNKNLQFGFTVPYGPYTWRYKKDGI